jgi:hypothetical protein
MSFEKKLILIFCRFHLKCILSLPFVYPFYIKKEDNKKQGGNIRREVGCSFTMVNGSKIISIQTVVMAITVETCWFFNKIK